MIFLIIVNLAGNIERVPMKTEVACERAAHVFNVKDNTRIATAYCIKSDVEEKR